MAFGIVLQPTVAGLACAAAAVVAGAPWFSDGLRALRLTRAFRGMRSTPLAECGGGLAWVQGEVVLESPLFSPLSGTPCAGYRLEVRGPRGRVARPIDQFRPFHLADGGQVARVLPEGGRFDLAERLHREFAPREAMSQNLQALLERAPEVAWMRRGGVTLTVTERVLAAGTLCHVVGTVRHSRLVELEGDDRVRRTGTDDVVVEAGTVELSEPDCWIEAGDALDYLLISDAAPRVDRLRVHPLRVAGAFAGPALSLGGLLLLADAADRMRALGG